LVAEGATLDDEFDAALDLEAEAAEVDFGAIAEGEAPTTGTEAVPESLAGTEMEVEAAELAAEEPLALEAEAARSPGRRGRGRFHRRSGGRGDDRVGEAPATAEEVEIEVEAAEPAAEETIEVGEAPATAEEVEIGSRSRGAGGRGDDRGR